MVKGYEIKTDTGSTLFTTHEKFFILFGRQREDELVIHAVAQKWTAHPTPCFPPSIIIIIIILTFF